MFCIHCGGQISDGSKFCTLCGKPQSVPAPAVEPVPVAEPAPVPVAVPPVSIPEPEPIPICIHCGQPLKPQAKFCIHCGNVQEVPAQEVPAVEIPAPVFIAPEPEVEIPAPVFIAPEQPQGSFCIQCGAPLNPGAKFCVQCGATQGAAQTPTKEEAVPKKKKGKKGLVIAIVCVILAAVLGVGGWFGYQHLPKFLDYQEAQEDLKEGDLSEALAIFQKLGDFKDSQAMVVETEKRIAYRDGVNALNGGRVFDAVELLTELDYEDSQEKLQEAQALVTAYDDAYTLMIEGYLDEAEEAFREISYVEDSQLMLDHEIPMLRIIGMLEKTDARDPRVLEQIGWSGDENTGFVQAYETVIDDLDALGDEEETRPFRSQACLGLSMLYLELGDLEKAQEASTGITDEDQKAQYQSLQEDFEALNQYMTAWENALGVRMDCLNGGSYDCAQELKTFQANMETYSCPDEEMRNLAAAYASVVEKQQALLNGEGKLTSLASWLELEIQRYQVLDTMNQDYGFLNNNATLKDTCIGQVPFTRAWLAVEASFQKQFSNETMITSEGEAFYLTYINDTEYEFTLELTLAFLDAEMKVLAETPNTFTLKPGETSKLALELPEHDYWTARYAVKEVQLPESV